MLNRTQGHFALHIFSALQQCAQATWQGTLVLVEVSGVLMVEVVVALALVVVLVEALAAKGEFQKQLDEEFATNLAFIFRFVSSCCIVLYCITDTRHIVLQIHCTMPCY